MEPHHLHVPQADMLVAESKPLTFLTLRQNNLQRLGYSQKLVRTIGMDLASDTCGLIMANSKTYMLIWLVDLKALCIKQILSYLLNHFLFQLKMRQIWHENQCLFYPCSPIKFYFRNWNEEIFCRHPCHLLVNVHNRGHG